jgi:hypothetical protein
MSGRLRRRYERLLVTYPSAYRRAHGDEMLGTLLDAARPDQRFPASREAGSLLLGGLRTRARQTATQSPRRLWTDGLQLGVLLIVLVNLGHALGHALQSPFPLWIALVALTALAVLRGWTRTALIAATVTALAAARPLLPQVSLPWWLPGYGDWSVVARYAIPAAVLAILAWPRIGRPQARSWWWLLLPAAAMLPLAGDGWALAQAGLEVGLLLVVLVVAVAALDPRPAVGAAVYLTPGLLYAAEETITTGVPSTLALGYWAVLAALMVGFAAAVWRSRRHQLRQREP